MCRSRIGLLATTSPTRDDETRRVDGSVHDGFEGIFVYILISFIITRVPILYYTIGSIDIRDLRQRKNINRLMLRLL